MAEGLTIWFLVAANLVFVTLGSLLVWTVIGRDSPATPESWYAETQRLAAEIVQITRTDPTGSIDRELLPLSIKLKRHAASAPASIDERSLRQAYQLSVRCESLVRRANGRSETPPGLLPEDRLSEVRELATALEATARSNT